MEFEATRRWPKTGFRVESEHAVPAALFEECPHPRERRGPCLQAHDCIKFFSETDQTEDLRKFDVPTLFIHGDDDEIVPIAASAQAASKLVKGSTLKVYPGAPHGLTATHKDQVNADLLAFLRA